MSSKTQSSFCETANEILQLALSLKESFEATESQKSFENSDVGAETRNLTFDAASETSRFSRKRKKKLKIPEPKKRKEDEIVSSNVPQSENVKQNLLENIKTVSESQATESEKTSDNLGVGAETQNLTFDAAIETTRFSCKLKKNLQIPEPKRRKEERNVSSNVTQSENAKQCLNENIKKLSEVDVETLNSTFEATNKTSRNYHQHKRKIEKLEVGVETQNSIFDATNKTSRNSHPDKQKIEKLEVGVETQNSIFDATIKTSRNSRQHKRNIENLEVGVENQNSIFDTTIKTSRNSHQDKQKIEKLEVGVETQSSIFDATIKTSRNSCQHTRKIEKLEVGVETQNSISNATNKRSRNYHQHRQKIEKLEVGVETQNSTFDATIKTSRSSRQVEIDKIRIMQVNAHGALTSTKLHKSEIILVNEFIQDLLEKHIQYYQLLGPNITLIEDMVKDLLLLKSEKEAVPKVKIKVDELQRKNFKTCSMKSTKKLLKTFMTRKRNFTQHSCGFHITFIHYDIILTIVLI